MTISTFMGLQTSLRGLLAHQAAIDTTSHNVANANTEGYSRQEASLSATDAIFKALVVLLWTVPFFFQT